MKRTASSVAALVVGLATLVATSGAGAQEQGENSGGLQEIIVTATRRATNLMKTPDSISVFTQADIEAANITRTRDYVQLTPNVSMGENRAGEAWIAIRGLTNFRFGDPSVAMIVDGIQVLDADGLNRDLFDVGSIQVLKGPQGGLYGRGAIGGAIVVESVAPTAAPEGWLKVGYGNNDSQLYQGAIGGSLVGDQVTGRISLSHRSTDGSFKNIRTGVHVTAYKDTSANAALRLAPTETLSIDVRYGKTKVTGPGTAFVAQLTAEGYDANNASRPFESEQRGDQFQDIDMASARAKLELPFADLTYSLAWYDMNRGYAIDTIPYRYDFGVTSRTARHFQSWTHEARLASPDAATFRWTVGAFKTDISYRTRSMVSDDTTGISVPEIKIWPKDSPWPTLSFSDDAGSSDAWAFYANASYDLTDTLHATAALRYDKETRKQTNVAYGWSPAAGSKVDNSWDKFQPKAQVSWDFMPKQMAYMSAARGFKSGGFNPSGTEAAMRKFNPNSTVRDIVDAQVVDNVELGYKGGLFDNRLKLQVAAFKSWLRNAQSFEFNLAASSNVISTARRATVTGFEAEAQVAVTDDLVLNAALGLLDGEITRFPDIPTYEGNKLPNVPNSSVNLGATYSRSVGADAEATLHVNYRREGSRFFNWANTSGTKRDAVDLVDARLAMAFGQFEAAIWSKNLTNKLYFDDYVPVIPIAAAAFKAQRRTFGADLKVRF